MPFRQTIKGNIHTDERGSLQFFNDLDLSEVVRLYEIIPKIGVVRAWQGHKSEKKWLYCSQGSFVLNLVAVDNFEKPSVSLRPEKKVLRASQPEIVCVPEGYANGFIALEKYSKLVVFSNYNLTQSKQDDYRFKSDFWSANWKP